MNRPITFKLACLAVAVSALGLTACGGSDAPATVAVVSAPVTVGVAAATAPAALAVLANQTLTFASASLTDSNGVLSAVPFTGITFGAAAGSTSVPFTLTGVTGVTGGTSAKGTMTFGSCIFTVTELPVGNVLATPLVYTIPTANCQISVNTTNVPANGSTGNRNVTYTIGSSTSSILPVSVTVAADGKVSVGGVVIGRGNVVQPTGL